MESAGSRKPPASMGARQYHRRSVALEVAEGLSVEGYLCQATRVRELGNGINAMQATCEGCQAVADGQWSAIVAATSPSRR